MQVSLQDPGDLTTLSLSRLITTIMVNRMLQQFVYKFIDCFWSSLTMWMKDVLTTLTVTSGTREIFFTEVCATLAPTGDIACFV